MFTNIKIRIYPAGIYLFQVNKKRHQNDLIDMKALRNTDVALVSLFFSIRITYMLLHTKNYNQIKQIQLLTLLTKIVNKYC